MKNDMQLFCFTFAGGTSSFFDTIEKDLCDIEVIKLEYAGHGTRHREPFYNDFNELAADMLFQMKNLYHGKPYAMFGYSMGSISAVEVLKKIMADGSMPMPSHVFLAAHEPHEKAELNGYTPFKLDEWVKERTIRFGAVPEKLIDNEVFWRTYLPIYRADYSLIGKYEFRKLNLKTTVPATVFYSETDTPSADIEKWKMYFVGDCKLYRFSGDHFFIRSHHEEMADIIMKRMEVQE